MQQRYQIFGMRGAGSLIAEFMLTAVGQDYDISFSKSDEMRQPAFRALNPLGEIPVLVCLDGQSIRETLAITAHLLEVFPTLAPPGGSAARAPALAISGDAGNLHLSFLPPIKPNGILCARDRLWCGVKPRR